MIHSMTGYGKSVCEHDKTTYTIEIKTINSKQADINVKIPYFLKEKELEIRNLLSNSLKRGKIELYVIQDVTEPEPSMSINKKIVSNYFEQLQQIVKELNIESDENLLSLALNMPDVLNKEVEQLDDELWSHIKKSIKEAIESVNTYRQSEGKILEKDIRSSISLIHKKLNEITPLEKNRIIKTKERLEKNLKEIEANSDINYDKDRLEQEMLYYLDKLDINEEKVRLENHCNYFLNTLEEEGPVGKKLGFISQEILREINTIGSKANDSDIQTLVVEMKNEQEKVKEQLMNIL